MTNRETSNLQTSVKMYVVVNLLIIFCINTKFEVLADNKTNASLIRVLFNNSMEFQRILTKLVDVNLEIPAQLKKKVIYAMKSYAVVEPTPKETIDADKALNEAFGLTSGFSPDSNETMEDFCE